MPLPRELENWISEVSSAFADLSQAQVWVLALYSYGMALTQRCGQTIVAVFLARLLGEPSNNLRQRLREWTYEAGQKRGKKRRELRVAGQFAPLLRWVIEHWAAGKQIVLGVDVTYLGERFMILTISVLYGQTAIPVAWQVLKGKAQGEWHPLWVQLLADLQAGVPKDCTLWLLFDRGLYSKRLFQAVRQQGWHPFMRIRTQGSYKQAKRHNWRKLQAAAWSGMRPYVMRVHCFKGDPLKAYLWVQWDLGQAEPRLLLSDLAPRHTRGNPYPLRMWIEANFKDWKRGGLRLEQTKMTDPQRLARLLLVVALTNLYLIRAGQMPHTTAGPLLPSTDLASRLSVPMRGYLTLLATVTRDATLPPPTPFHPYSLPHFIPPPKTYP